LLRRKILKSDQGLEFSIDLGTVYSLQDGDAFEFDDGTLIGVTGAEELLMEVTGNLVRLAWQLGSKGIACQINEDHILIAHDHVAADMLRGLGATVAEVSRPFKPEAGAYGIGPISD
jgi:urease accessory protein